MARRLHSYVDPQYCRVLLVKDAPVPHYGMPVTNSREMARIVREHCKDLPSEAFYTLVLDARRRVLAVVQVSIGTLTQSFAHPREVFQACLLAHGAGVAVAHNHPSGDPAPSPEDHAVTRRLREAGELLAIPVLDHIIVGTHDSYFSYADSGWPRL